VNRNQVETGLADAPSGASLDGCWRLQSSQATGLSSGCISSSPVCLAT